MHALYEHTFLWYLEVFIFSELLAYLKILVQNTAVPLEQKHYIHERGCSHHKPGRHHRPYEKNGSRYMKPNTVVRLTRYRWKVGGT
jgi:hypothetical protein